LNNAKSLRATEPHSGNLGMLENKEKTQMKENTKIDQNDDPVDKVRLFLM